MTENIRVYAYRLCGQVDLLLVWSFHTKREEKSRQVCQTYFFTSVVHPYDTYETVCLAIDPVVILNEYGFAIRKLIVDYHFSIIYHKYDYGESRDSSANRK